MQTVAQKCQYFDNLPDAAVFSLAGIYEEDYIRKNYTSSTSKIRKIIKNLQDKGFILKDKTINKYVAFPYEVHRIYYFDVTHIDNPSEEISKFIKKQVVPPEQITPTPTYPAQPYIWPDYTKPYYPTTPNYPTITCMAHSDMPTNGVDSQQTTSQLSNHTEVK